MSQSFFSDETKQQNRDVCDKMFSKCHMCKCSLINVYMKCSEHVRISRLSEKGLTSPPTQYRSGRKSGVYSN